MKRPHFTVRVTNPTKADLEKIKEFINKALNEKAKKDRAIPRIIARHWSNVAA